MTDCCNSIHGSTSSSDIASLRRGGNSRIRVARLVRPQSQSSRRIVLGRGTSLYGFAIRGGREFGTGFFISNIEKGSQADLKGLKVGDQIIRVNGYHVDDAVHRELSQFISNQDRVTLKVRGIGMIPVKERSNDSLSWHIVPINKQNPNEAALEHSGNQDISIQLSVPPRTKLGLGICKGPVWKPGIYVQFTKDFGVAQQAGLRPGDQILYCNGISFADISFCDAVTAMKSSYVLQLTVRAASGLELFPGESSGYNSSASSITEEQIPAWIEQSSKRLSAMNKDSEQLIHIRTKKSERLKIITPPRVPNKNLNDINEKCNKNGTNTTIIKLSENGTVINNTLIPNIAKKMDNNIKNRERGDNCSIVRVEPNDNNNQINQTCNEQKSNDHKIVTVDVHRTGMGDCVPPPPPNQLFLNSQSSSLSRSTSITSSSCGGSSVDKSSLSSAIFEEVKRRAARTNNPSEQSSNNNQKFKNPSKIIGNSIADKNSEKHNALMDEFKKAHRKMFRNGFNEFGEPCKERQTSQNGNNNHVNEQQQQVTSGTDDVDNKIQNNYAALRNRIEYESSLSTKILNGDTVVRKSSFDLLNVTNDLPETPLPDYDSTPSNTLTKINNYNNNVNHQQNGGSIIINKTNESVKGTMGRVAATEIAKANGAAAEMESIESFKMTNPSSPVPKPPSVYFAPQSTGPATMKKSQRPVSVTIGEYGNLNDRRQPPSKFDFIARSNGDTKNDDVSVQLKNELEKTLSRSNLKKRTDLDDKKLLNGNNVAVDHEELHTNSKSIVFKTHSGNFDKLSTVLTQHQNNINNKNINNNIMNNNNNNNNIIIINRKNNNNFNNNDTTNTKRITITIPPQTVNELPNSILKTNIKTHGNNNINVIPEQKNIKFENISKI